MINLIATVIHLGVDGFLITYVALKLLKINVSLTKLLLIVGIYATSVFLIRKIYIFFGIPFGTHTLILLGLLIILLRFIANSPWVYAVPGAVVPFLLVYLASPLAYRIVVFFNWTNEQVFANPWLLLIAGLTELTYLFITAVILKVTDFNIPELLKIGR